MLGENVEKIKLSHYGLLSNFRLFCSFAKNPLQLTQLNHKSIDKTGVLGI